MAIRRLNHAVLYVRDVATSVAFYTEALGFTVLTESPGAAFLRASGSTNDHDLGLFGVGAGAPPPAANTVGLYHLAWEVETLAELRDVRTKLTEMGSLVGQSDHSTTKSLYAKDPDGIEFEVCWLVPKDRLDLVTSNGTGVAPLDLDAELALYGATTVGGLGVSWPG
jgi:catechol-2,3-dioxygenase